MLFINERYGWRLGLGLGSIHSYVICMYYTVPVPVIHVCNLCPNSTGSCVVKKFAYAFSLYRNLLVELDLTRNGWPTS